MDVAARRRAKDDYLKRSHDSPLTHEQRHGFAGLRYFDPNPELRFELPLDASAAGPAEDVEMSDGTSERMPRAGTLEFSVEGKQARLVAYRSHGDEELFVPFRDATSRDETYPAGRYVEAERLPNGRYALDFNLAYNPYCAYNENWRCPLAPPHNWLDVPIRAGEKRFHD